MRIHLLAGVVAVTCLASGCATNPDGTSPNIFSDFKLLGSRDASPEQEALRKQAKQHKDYAKTRLMGAATGAVLGGIAGSLLSRDNARGAVIGAVAGGVAGYAGASYLTRDHTEFVATRESLQEDIKAANEDGANSQENVHLAQAALDYQRGEIARLNAAYAAGEASADQYERSLAEIVKDRESVQSMIDVSEERIARMESSIGAYREAGLDPAELEAANEAQARDLANLRRIEDAMVDLLADAPEGVESPSVA